MPQITVNADTQVGSNLQFTEPADARVGPNLQVLLPSDAFSGANNQSYAAADALIGTPHILIPSDTEVAADPLRPGFSSPFANQLPVGFRTRCQCSPC